MFGMQEKQAYSGNNLILMLVNVSSNVCTRLCMLNTRYFTYILATREGIWLDYLI